MTEIGENGGRAAGKRVKINDVKNENDSARSMKRTPQEKSNC